MIGMERCVVLCIWSLLACGSAGHVKGPNSKLQQALPDGNFGMDNTNSGRKTMIVELLKASTTEPTITSAPSSSSAPTSSHKGKKSKGGKGASVESPSSGFYPRTKGKKSSKSADVPGNSTDMMDGNSYVKSGKKQKSKGASKLKIKNSKKSRSKKGEESMTPTSPGK